MGVLLNEPSLQLLLNSPVGRVGLYAKVAAEMVEARARENASGPVIGIRSGDLLAGLSASPPEPGPLGPSCTVGSTAVHRDFVYPPFHDQNGRPWLSGAMDVLEARGWVVSHGSGVAV